MTIPQSKNELISAIDDNFNRLDNDIRSIPAERAEDKTMEGHAQGTSMSVHDLASYLLGWNKLVLDWIEKDGHGEPIEFPAPGFQWNELGALAQKFYNDYEALPFDDVVAKLAHAKDDIVAFVEQTSNDRLYGSPWYRKYTMGRMIQLNTASPYANARSRLRKWKRDNVLGEVGAFRTVDDSAGADPATPL